MSNNHRTGLFVAPGLTNLKMNSDVYAKRREVIVLIHEAKRLLPIELPRITVRIAENHARILGCARPGECVMWITERSVASKQTVFHEILHAVFRQPHVTGCPLMHPSNKFKSATSAELDRLFVQYATAVR
jgi:hypothetical protein